MYSNRKTVLIVVCTFFIGMVAGALLNGTIMRHHFERRVSRLRTPEGFVRRMEKAIEPSPLQRAAIRKVLLKHFDNMFQFRKEWPALMDSLQHDLSFILTEEQMARFKRSTLYPPQQPFRRPFERRPSGRKGGAPESTEPKK